MRKLRLDVEDIEVTSFETHVAGEDRGTVMGHKTVPVTLMSCATCVVSCGGACLSVEGGTACLSGDPWVNTCNPSCVGSCDPCPTAQGGSCDAMATCLQYYTCAYATCVGCVAD